MARQGAGLPMTSKWDPERLQQEVEVLKELNTRPFLGRVRGYLSLTGPGWMQSAMTLGAGSAVASVVAGAFYGYQLLWVQPIAMLMGIAMMSALGNIVLTKRERAYSSVSRELHVGLAFVWALATLVATIIWHFPQYGLAGAAMWDAANILGISNPVDAGGEVTSRMPEFLVKFAVGFAVLFVSINVVWSYGSKPKGIKIYETFLRWVIRLVILAFLIVVVRQFLRGGLDVVAIIKGFTTFQIPEENRQQAITTILGAIGAAVGINMTFLYPYSILAKGWGPHHKGLARFDLFGSLLLPYVVLTSLIMIAMASTLHQPPFGTNLATNPGLTELRPIDAAQSLAPLLGEYGGRLIFNLGFFGMACGAITAHMVVCGFTVCEMFGLEYTPGRYKLFSLLPAVGVIGVMFPAPLWLPIAASAIAFSMLPIAYIVFFILQNRRSYLGEAVGQGGRRTVFNIILLLAVGMSLIGSYIQLNNRVIKPIQKMWAPPAEEKPADPAPAVAPAVDTPAVVPEEDRPEEEESP